jgi:acetoin utilization protein AcuC
LTLQDLPAEWIEPDDATDDQILVLHALPFVEAVKFASAAHGPPSSLSYGLGTSDVPVFLGMHEATQSVCGGSIEGARQILDQGAQRVLQLSGGLHHAMPGRAAGFCVYNDVALAIQEFVAAGKRVAFVDIDVHHSDGVQEMFYNEPSVLTISLHQSGRTLFPGTGFVHERGGPEAPGSAINVPLEPSTGNESYLECFDAVVPDAVAAFKPDVMVVEVGADAHLRDPLAQLDLTTSAFVGLFERITKIAESSAAGKLLVTLGGGYGFDATMRIWSLLAYRLADTSPPEEFPEEWLTRWRERTRLEIRSDLHDPGDEPSWMQMQAQAARLNRETVEELTRLLGQTQS